jgi:hypothetical protein
VQKNKGRSVAVALCSDLRRPFFLSFRLRNIEGCCYLRVSKYAAFLGFEGVDATFFL